jgi:hypothetical protein
MVKELFLRFHATPSVVFEQMFYLKCLMQLSLNSDLVLRYSLYVCNWNGNVFENQNFFLADVLKVF